MHDHMNVKVCRLLYSKGRSKIDNIVATAVYTTLFGLREKQVCTSYNASYKYLLTYSMEQGPSWEANQ